ncbi:uncharacterized protein CTRU02_214724 [Colletotrichum truncatum]|uniref:Uncharacterized protein n=1 Tax=Colletotrichum truncatum TaxID=5467 RepID=A0ACC3YFI6_COLTU|nr:uncharacterized protein CTRU02_09669 [Colletotrichum truncatum]KAF6788351.1 hypothetical protein CTRU02_09669 [Colletotrichum truncatum]
MAPTVLSPASPSELLHYIVTYQTYPTTLIICCSQEEFISSLVADVRKRSTQEDSHHSEEHPPHPLLAAPLFQEAIARHIRLLFIPTVIHLRANLSVFSPEDSLVPPPPNISPSSGKHHPPLLLVYGFLHLHRDSSEWSAQGISCSAALLVEAARRTAFKPVIVEPKHLEGHNEFEALLHDDAPILSGSSRRTEGGWTGRTVEIRRVLGRWFHFQTGQWDIQWEEHEAS